MATQLSPADGDHLIREDRTPVSEGPAPTWSDLRALEARLESNRSARIDAWTAAIGALAAIAVVLSVISVGFAIRAVDESKKNLSAAGAAPSATTATTVAVATIPAGSNIDVGLSEYNVALPSTSFAAGSVTLQIANNGTVQHELLVFKSDLPPGAYPIENGDINEEAPGITKVSDGDNIDPGGTQVRSVDLTQPGSYLFVCNLPGHFKSGMYKVVTVKG